MSAIEAAAAADEPELFEETIGGALIDAARISTMAALRDFPPPAIILPNAGEEPSVGECLAQALNWLELARALSIEQSPHPVTSLHHVNQPKGEGHAVPDLLARA